MNFVRSRLAVGNLVARRCRQVTETWGHRRMCNKPAEMKADTQPAAPAHAEPRPTFKIPGYRPSNMDRKILLWTGRFKTADQIPEFLPYETIDAARNRMRVRICYVMIAATVAACMVMIALGKRAVGRNESLTVQNMEKKARWREEVQREREAAMSHKPQ